MEKIKNNNGDFIKYYLSHGVPPGRNINQPFTTTLDNVGSIWVASKAETRSNMASKNKAPILPTGYQT